MPYGLIVSRHATRLLKKLAPNIRDLILKEFETISKNPYQASSLSGKVSFLRSWRTHIQGVPYRIIMEIQEQAKKIVIHLFAKRADVYKLLDRLFR